MNKEASRGISSNKSWPLDVLFRSVLHFCEKEIMDNIQQNLPPLVHKKMFMHVLFRVRVRLSRLFVIYKWNMKQIQIQRKPENQNSYFFRLQLSVDHLHNIYNYFHNLSFKVINYNINFNHIEMPIVHKKTLINSNDFFKNTILQTKMHKSVTGVQLIRDKLIVVSKNKYQFTVKFKKGIKLLHFKIFYSKDVNIEPVLKKIAQNCFYILNHIPNPLYHCCEFLERVYMFLYFTLICKTLQSYQNIHKFTMYQNNHGNVILNFYELHMKYSLILLQSSVCIFSQDEQLDIKLPIEKVEDIPSILSKIQNLSCINLFTKFKRYINEWLLISKCFSTSIDELNCYFYLYFFDNPISKISVNSENELQCNYPQFLNSLLTQNDKLFFEFIKFLEIRAIAECTGFLNLVLYDDSSFERALKAIKDNDVSSKYLLFLGPTNNFLKNIYIGDTKTLLYFKQIFLIATRPIVYRNLSKKLLQLNFQSIITGREMIIRTNIYGVIRFKIDENSYWSLKFGQANICRNMDFDMAIMFQGHCTYFRFSSWIDNLISSVLSTMNIIDQTYHQYRTYESVTVFNILQKTGLFFKGICPTLNTTVNPDQSIFLNLQPIQFVGSSIHYDVFEVYNFCPLVKIHFINKPSLDFSISQAIKDGSADQRFGPFLNFSLPLFPLFFEAFKGTDWCFMDISLRGTFSLMYQSKYMLYFQQQAKNCFNVAIPPIGKSIILNIPLSIFPIAQSSNPMKKNKANTRKPMLIRMEMIDLAKLRDSVIIFFNEQKFLKNFGFSLLLYNAKSNVIVNSDTQAGQDYIKMRASLGATGLAFEVLEDIRRPCIYSIDKLLSMPFSSRSTRFRILNFLFDSLKMEKPTCLGLYESLKCLLENEDINVDWEKSLLNSTVDIPNNSIKMQLFINNQEYTFSIDSSQESNDSEDALVTVTKPDGDVLPPQKLKSDFKSWMADLVSQINSERVLFDFRFL